MPTDRSFQAPNAETRQRLEALVSRLTDADLARRLPGGWTVAATLVHLAFWDLRAVALMDRLRAGRGGDDSPIDADVVNDTVLALAAAVPPRAATRLAVEAARAADEGIERLPDALVEEARARGVFSLTRHVHRGEHLDAITHAL